MLRVCVCQRLLKGPHQLALVLPPLTDTCEGNQTLSAVNH